MRASGKAYLELAPGESLLVRGADDAARRLVHERGPASWPSQMPRIGKVRQAWVQPRKRLNADAARPRFRGERRASALDGDSRPCVEMAVRRLAVRHDLFARQAGELEKRLVLPIPREVVLRKPSLLPRLLVEPRPGERNGAVELLEVEREPVRESERLLEALAGLAGETRERNGPPP